MKKLSWLISAILMSCLYAAAAVAGSIPITNSGFEADVLADGSFTIFTLSGWSTFGGVGYGAGAFNPTTAQYAGGAPEGQNVGWMVAYNSAGLAQTLGTTYVAGQTYTLTALVGDRDDYARASFHLGLFASGNPVADSSEPLPPEGGFTLVTTVFDADSTVHGLPIEIRLFAYTSGDVDPDQDPGAGGTVVDFDDVHLDSTVTVTAVRSHPATTAAFELYPPVPNPFNPRTTVAFELTKSASVQLRVFDVSGRLIRALVDGDVLPAGRREIEWDGRDDRGQEVATGVYFCRLDAGDYHSTVRMVLVK